MKNKNLTNGKDRSAQIFLLVFAAGILTKLLIFGVGVLFLRRLDPDKKILDFMAQAGDVPHYINIAQNGYASYGENANKIVLYPLFPLLMRILATVFRNYTVSGLIISYAAFGTASAYLYKLMRIDYDVEKSVDALLLMFIAPYGLFFTSIHTESLFLALSITTLYYARKENWLAASLIGYLTALTKTQGVIILAPVVYELIICSIRDKKFKKSGLFAMFIPLGFVTYLAINKIVQGDWFAFVAHQAAAPWYNTAKWISESLATSYDVGAGNFSLSLIIYHPQIWLFFVAVAFLFVGLYKNVRTSYLVFMGAYIMTTYLQGWMLSGARYITSCASIYIVMASIDNKIIKYIMYLGTGLLCICYMAMWLQGYAIM